MASTPGLVSNIVLIFSMAAYEYLGFFCAAICSTGADSFTNRSMTSSSAYVKSAYLLTPASVLKVLVMSEEQSLSTSKSVWMQAYSASDRVYLVGVADVIKPSLRAMVPRYLAE